MNERERIIFRLLVIPFAIALLLPYTLRNWFFQHHLELTYYFLVAALMSFGLMPLMYKLGMILRISVSPGGRHIHREETPRMGGIGIYITFVAVINIVSNPPAEFRALFYASSIIALIGIFDDIKGLPALVKLSAQIAATAIVINKGIVFSFIPDQNIGNVLSLILSAVWIIGIINAYNCIDGLDGLAAGIALLVLAFFSVLAQSMHANFMVIASLVLLGAIIGFLPYNFRYKKRALLFLGDSGSTLVGFLLATFAIYGSWGDNKGIDLAIPILLLIIPIADMVTTTITRISERKIRNLRQWFEYSGTDHIHHRLLAVGFSPKISVLILLGFTLNMGLIAYLIRSGDTQTSIIALVVAVFAAMNFFGLTVFYSKKKS